MTVILFVLLFLLCLFGVVLFPKTEGKINGVKALVMGMMLVFCYLSFLAFIFDKIGLGARLNTACISLALADIALWGVVIKEKKIQKLFFRWTDILGIAVVSAFVLGISMHMFTPELRLAYINTDPANHFNMAMQVAKTGELGGIYFSAYVDSLFIQVLAPFLSVGNYYKAFIVADIFMHVLEICMFYVLALTVSDRKIVRVFAPVFAVGYFFGYPAYSFMTGGFVYWGIGVMILILIVYALLLVERYPGLRKYTYILLFFAAYANSCCNRLFVPVNYFALIAALLPILLKGRKNLLNKKTVLTVLALLALTAAAGMLFINYWGSVDKILSYIQVVGWSYSSMYGDLIFFLPMMFLVCFYTLIKREHSKTISIMGLCMVLCTIVMYVCTYQKWMTFYYYYKIYYNLWLFGWLFAVAALEISAEKKQLPSYFSYGILMVGITALTLTNYDYNMWHHDANYNGEYATKNLFSLYRYNMDSLQTDYKDYTMSEELLAVYQYAVEELEDEQVPALITDQARYCWFDAMRTQSRDEGKKYWPRNNELMEIVRRLDKKDIEHVVVTKVDDFYITNKAYFDLCDVVYENDTAAIYARPGDSWTNILDDVENYSEEKLELYKYVKKQLNGERVPLMADRSAGVDFIIYRKRTKQSMTDCYSWKFDAKGNLDNLNELGIQYMLVFYDDPYYQSISTYLDSQETVFENGVGKIVRCSGENWSTQY